jgi:hypothetical protein
MRNIITERRGEGAASVVAIVAILVIVALAVWLLFFRTPASAPTDGTIDVNVDLPSSGEMTQPGSR